MELFKLHSTQAQIAIDAVQLEGGWVRSCLTGPGEHTAPNSDNHKAASAVQTHCLENPALMQKQR